ncbi:MAG TPA: DUF952 domain-containing protein [Gaiellaceae bacterium]|nr:DUF952 domain-containing protein [Gaiellaceae bacterium]
MDVLARITGFAVEAVNGSLGGVAALRRDSGEAFLVVRTPSGREQLLPVSVIEEIDVAEKRIRVYRSTREIDAAPNRGAALLRHYGPWGAGHRVLPAERSRQLITHIAERSEWETATGQGEYRPASLAGEGFVHASTAYQTLLPANLFYRGRRGLVLLAIDQARLRSEIRWEEPQPTVEAFPHIYGPVNVDAVVTVTPFEPGADGSFELPQAIRELADAYAADE